jgi:hypothetical protein
MNGFLYRLKITTKKRADFCNMKKDREHTEPLLNWTESIMEMLAKIRVESRKAKIKRLFQLVY